MPLSKVKPLAAWFIGVLSLSTLFSVLTASAQGNYYDNNREPTISIYEHCDFRGERRDIAVGEFRSMRELDFGNDKMSSIRVPSELEAVIFQHDKFKGDYARVSRDIRCFDKAWNDEVSSLKVEYRGNYYGGQSERGQGQVYGGQRNGRYDSEYGNDNRQYDRYSDGVNGKNLALVTYGNTVLENIGPSKWQMRTGSRGIAQYKELRRDENGVLLQNDYSAQQVRIDLAGNQVVVVNARGQERGYQISSRKAGSMDTNTGLAEPSTRFQNSCINYNVYTNGQAGGIRFSTGKDFIRFQERGYKGRICHRGEVTVELNKRDFDTDLTFEVDGRVFKFAAGEKETQFRANWYRKVIKLQVGY